MENEELRVIIEEVLDEISRPENRPAIEVQKLATALFYSVGLGILNNNDSDSEKVENLKFLASYIRVHDELMQ
jgi:hypothetical protein